MKAASANMIAGLAAGDFRFALCVRIELRDSTIFGFTTHIDPLTIDIGTGSVVYSPAAGFDVTSFVASNDFAVDNLELLGFVAGAVALEDVVAGRWDGCDVRAFWVNWAHLSWGIVREQRGSWAKVRWEDGKLNAEFRGMADRLNNNSVGELYAPNCRALFGRATMASGRPGCKYPIDPAVWTALTVYDNVRPAHSVSLAASPYPVADFVSPVAFNDRIFELIVAGTSGASEPAWNLTIGGLTIDGTCTWRTVRATTLPCTVATILVPRAQFTVTVTTDAASTWLKRGQAIFTSGANAGYARELIDFTLAGSPLVATVTLFLSAPFAIEVGDTLDLQAWCSKFIKHDTLPSCFSYDNRYNFRGEPPNLLPGDKAFASADSPE